MSLRFGAVFLAAAAVVTTAACRVSDAGRLEASWTGTDTAEVALPATASWCVAGRYLEVRAMQGDTGVAMALFPADSAPTMLVGEYAATADSADSLRPAAVVVVRWADPGMVYGVRSDSGAVVVRSDPDGALSGDFTASGYLAGSERRRLDVGGTFQRLRIDTAADDCPLLRPEPPAPDSSIDSLHGNDVLP